MDIKKGDTVTITKGKDRGKNGKVLRVIPKSDKVLIEGLNMFKKHSRPKTQGAKGETITLAKPLQVSNVLLYCGSCKRGVRVKYPITGETKSRVCARCVSKI